MNLALGVIIALTALALTTLFGLAFLIGGILIGTLSFLGYVVGGSLGAALACAGGVAMVLSATRSRTAAPSPKTGKSRSDEPLS